MTYVFNQYTGQLDAVQSLLVLDERYIKKFPTGSTNLITVDTTSSEALILKTSTDDPTKNLFEVQDSNGDSLVEIDVAGSILAPQIETATGISAGLIIRSGSNANVLLDLQNGVIRYGRFLRIGDDFGFKSERGGGFDCEAYNT